MFRPPLMPILVGGLLELFPHHSFLAWRIFDSAAFAIAACLLCDVAFVNGGMTGLVALLVILIGDPLRQRYIPGWYTEGLAFDFLSLTVWLMTNGNSLRLGRYNVYAALAVGMLCLDRAIFTLIMPLICLAVALARPGPRVARVKSGFVILALSMLIQMPWWVRNIAVSGRLMPLGTQGGINLPDEYGDIALQTGGAWTGQGIRDAWIPPSKANRPILIPVGFSKESFEKLWPSDTNDYRFDAMIYAAVCTSLQSEIAVSLAGQHTAMTWAKANYIKLPRLIVEKLFTQFKHRYLALVALLGVIGFFGEPKLARTVSYLGLLIASYFLGIAVTHADYRFLVSILPPLYVGMALGIASIVPLAVRLSILSRRRKCFCTEP